MKENEYLKNTIEYFLYEETEMGILIEEIIEDIVFDELIYGGQQWDYIEEIKICMSLQGFSK